jgi:hypothetical protein
MLPYKTLRRKNSAVESNINALEHHALDRCPNRGIDNFKKYVSMSVLAHNIHQLGALVQSKMQKQNRYQKASISRNSFNVGRRSIFDAHNTKITQYF